MMSNTTTSTTDVKHSPPTPILDGTTKDNSIAKVSESDDREYITGLKLLVVLGCLTLVVFIVLLDIAILGTAIPEITTEFNALADVGWYIGAYQLASATLQLMSGKLYTHFNNKYTFLGYLAFFELGSLICGVANSSSLFIGGRTIAGVGAAGIVNGGMTIISGAVPLTKRPRKCFQEQWLLKDNECLCMTTNNPSSLHRYTSWDRSNRRCSGSDHRRCPHPKCNLALVYVFTNLLLVLGPWLTPLWESSRPISYYS